jgi:phosphatidylethanolamine-binding protein (PEBP) family uncharacterized protein
MAGMRSPSSGGKIMLGWRHSKYLLAAGGVMLASWWMCSVASGATAPFRRTGFVLTSTTFKDGGMMPKRTASCNGGENISPQLAWANAPVAADMLNANLVRGATENFGPLVKSFAITEVSEEGGQGIVAVNMVIYGIPANVSSFAEGELNRPSRSGKFVVGRSGPPARIRPAEEDGTWRGPCAPDGAKPHHYIIKIMATNLDPGELPPGLSLAEFLAKLKDVDPDTTAIVGLYANP